MKKILVVVLSIFVLVGCSGGNSSNDTSLTREEYRKQVVTLFNEFSEKNDLSAIIGQPDKLGEAIDQLNKIIDKVIALQGPKDMEKEEKILDKALESYKELMLKVKDAGDNKAKLTILLPEIKTVIAQLQEAAAAIDK